MIKASHTMWLAFFVPGHTLGDLKPRQPSQRPSRKQVANARPPFTVTLSTLVLADRS